MNPGTIRNIADVEPRFGDWGSGYLAEAQDASFGVVTLRPGDAFDNHLHEWHTESFLVLHGEVELWLDRTDLLVLKPGDLYSCSPGVEHFLRNAGDTLFRAFFIKSPGISHDKVEVPWAPGEESQ